MANSPSAKCAWIFDRLDFDYHDYRSAFRLPIEIEKNARGALSRLYRHNDLAVQLEQEAVGILVFPDAKKLALGLGVETSSGILFKKQKPMSFHNLHRPHMWIGIGS
jgi:lipid-binding SYLF domain-containing protein